MSKCDFTGVKYFTPVNAKFTTGNFLKITAVKCFTPVKLKLRLEVLVTNINHI